MARVSEFYKGRRKKRSFAVVIAAVVLGLLVVAITMFYGIQKYAVISKDGVTIDIPMLHTGKETTDASGNTVPVFEPVDVAMAINEPDYSSVKANPKPNAPEIRAIFIPAADMTNDKITECAGRLVSGNALILEVKPREGNLLWNSQTKGAYDYAAFMSSPIDLQETVKSLKASDIYLAAQISCCVDELLAGRSYMGLTAQYGSTFRDDTGYWLDPYNMELRNYIVDLVRELYDMGFDEVILADVAHPDNGETAVYYTRDMSCTPSAYNAVCGFAKYVADELADREGVLSIYCAGFNVLQNGRDSVNGQDLGLFLKLYDRVYYETDKYAYTVSNLQTATPYVTYGKASDRFVPVVINYLPDNSSWVLIDMEESED